MTNLLLRRAIFDLPAALKCIAQAVIFCRLRKLERVAVTQVTGGWTNPPAPANWSSKRKKEAVI